MRTLAASLALAALAVALLATLYPAVVLIAVMHRLDPWLVEVAAGAVLLLTVLSASMALIVSYLLGLLLSPQSLSAT